MTNLMSFESTSLSASQVLKSWTSSANGQEINVDIPKEFQGLGNGFSPEDIYAFALQNCFIATFKVIAEKSRLVFEQIKIELKLVLDKDENQLMIMKDAYFNILIVGAENPEKTLRLLEKTTKACMILNSVKTTLHFSFKVDGVN